jgi:hypothetical protein
MFCKNGYTLSKIAVLNFKFSIWRTKNMKTLAVDLHLKSQFVLGLELWKILAISGGYILVFLRDIYWYFWICNLPINGCMRIELWFETRPRTTKNPSQIKLILITNFRYNCFYVESAMNWQIVYAHLTSFIVVILDFFKIHACVSPVQVTLETLIEEI